MNEQKKKKTNNEGKDHPTINVESRQIIYEQMKIYKEKHDI